MSTGDSLIHEEEGDGYDGLLIDCAESRTHQVMRTVRAPGEMSHEKRSDNTTELCRNERIRGGTVGRGDDGKGAGRRLEDDRKARGKMPAPGVLRGGRGR
jgi:hypothetical protein